jgi:hypothetical protein
MRRPFVISTGALALALLPALLSAQTPPAQQPPAGQPPAGQQPPAAAEPAKTEPPKVPFTSPAGVLLVQIKPGQEATFEEMIGKLKAGFAKTEDATVKQQASGIKVFKAAEPLAGNALYVIFIEPTVPNADYELFAMLQKVMTKEELSAPTTADMWKDYVAAFGAGLNKLSLTPVGGM